MQIELNQTQDVGKVTALFVIRYNQNAPGATEEIVINGRPIRIPSSAARPLRTVFDNTEVISGLTAGWAPWFWMDCICINEADRMEAEKQRKLEPYIYTIAKWTLDCTGQVAQIKLGTNAYTSAVVNLGGPTDVMENLIAAGEGIDNINRLGSHVPGRVIWQASR